MSRYGSRTEAAAALYDALDIPATLRDYPSQASNTYAAAERYERAIQKADARVQGLDSATRAMWGDWVWEVTVFAELSRLSREEPPK